MRDGLSLAARKASSEIDKEDVKWALRLAMLHLSDSRKILNDVEYGGLQDLLRRTENLRLKFGDKLEPRHVLMHLYRQLKTILAAEALYSLLVDEEKAALARVDAETFRGTARKQIQNGAVEGANLANRSVTAVKHATPSSTPAC